jgi:hypothetical protein
VLSQELVLSARVADEHEADVAELLEGNTSGYGGQIGLTPMSFELVGAFRLQPGASALYGSRFAHQEPIRHIQTEPIRQ